MAARDRRGPSADANDGIDQCERPIRRTVGVVGSGGADAALLTFGVFCGSASWWVLLTSVVAVFRARLTVDVLIWVNRVSGAVLLVFGIGAIATGIAAAAAG